MFETIGNPVAASVVLNGKLLDSEVISQVRDEDELSLLLVQLEQLVAVVLLVVKLIAESCSKILAVANETEGLFESIAELGMQSSDCATTESDANLLDESMLVEKTRDFRLETERKNRRKRALVNKSILISSNSGAFKRRFL